VLQLTVGEFFYSDTFRHIFVCLGVTVRDATSNAFSAHSGKALLLLPVL